MAQVPELCIKSKFPPEPSCTTFMYWYAPSVWVVTKSLFDPVISKFHVASSTSMSISNTLLSPNKTSVVLEI